MTQGDPEEQVTLRRPNQWSQAPARAAAPVVEAAPSEAAPVVASDPAGASAATPPPAADAPADDAGLVAIASPMVGTFYAAASPDVDAFVSVGAKVSTDTVVCMVEAMKIFNEIKADCSGTIERVCVSNGDAIEFGQDLFMVRPA